MLKVLAYLVWLALFWGWTVACTHHPVFVNLTGFNILMSATVSLAGFLYLWPQRWFEDKV